MLNLILFDRFTDRQALLLFDRLAGAYSNGAESKSPLSTMEVTAINKKRSNYAGEDGKMKKIQMLGM